MNEGIAQPRIPPHSTEAEQSVLGSLLLDNEALQRTPGLVPEAFFSHVNADVFRSILAIAATGQPFDPMTVFDHMGEKAEGGLAYLNSLAQVVPSAGSARRYAEIVLEKWQLRQLVSAGDQIASMGFEAGDPAAQVSKAQMLLAKLVTSKGRREPRLVRDSLPGYLQLLDDLSQGLNPALSTGIRGLDRLMNGGLRRGEMMVIGARPKHGKTALALALARNFARHYWTLFLSQEMAVNQLMHRHTAALGSIDLSAILRADPADVAMWAGVREAADRMEYLKLLHDDQCALQLMDIRRKALKVKREHGLDVLIVDFLQLMQGAGKPGADDNRNRELDVISNGIKQLAMDLDCGAVVLSQMNREADKHYGRPTMTNLRDSGAIEAAADQIALLFTDHAHPMSPKLNEFAGYSELEIVAHRNGPQGLVHLALSGQYQQVGDYQGEPPTRARAKANRGME